MGCAFSGITIPAECSLQVCSADCQGRQLLFWRAGGQARAERKIAPNLTGGGHLSATRVQAVAYGRARLGSARRDGQAAAVRRRSSGGWLLRLRARTIVAFRERPARCLPLRPHPVEHPPQSRPQTAFGHNQGLSGPQHACQPRCGDWEYAPNGHIIPSGQL